MHCKVTKPNLAMKDRDPLQDDKKERKKEEETKRKKEIERMDPVALQSDKI